jgi:hypothetical protein
MLEGRGRIDNLLFHTLFYRKKAGPAVFRGIPAMLSPRITWQIWCLALLRYPMIQEALVLVSGWTEGPANAIVIVKIKRELLSKLIEFWEKLTFQGIYDH